MIRIARIGQMKRKEQKRSYESKVVLREQLKMFLTLLDFSKPKS